MSESEASQVSLSSPSQKFVPEEDDDETLWEVIEITAEKGGSYKVKWKGNDPKTMKPWPQSWVLKADCTDDLVKEWKRKQKEKGKGRKSVKGGRASMASRKTGRDSTSTVRTSTSRQPVASGSKITRQSSATTTTAAVGRPTRRSTLVPVITKTIPRKSNVAQHTDGDDDDDDEVKPAHSKSKGKKRKLDDATSANSSANRVPKHTSVDINVDQEGETVTKKPVGRPRKKRKIQVEVTKIEPESGDENIEDLVQSNNQVRQEESYAVGKVTGKIASPEEDGGEDEDKDERMVEDGLSQASPPPDFGSDEDIYARSERAMSPELPPIPFKGKGKGTPLFSLDSVNSTPPIKIGPPISSRPISRTQTKNNKSNKIPHIDTRNVSVSDLHLEPKRHSSRKRAESRMPTEERSVFWDGDTEELQYPSYEPLLSPAALERLALFDKEVMGIIGYQSTSAVVVLTKLEPVTKEPVVAKPPSKEQAKVTATDTAQEPTSDGGKRSTSSISKGSEEAKTIKVNADKLSKAKQPPSGPAAASTAKGSFSRTTTKPPLHAYDTEIVPETDASQSQEVTQPSPTTMPAPKPQSKSRSPPTDEDRPSKSKKLRPIPVISPSTFYPHLPGPSSSLPEDISEDPSQERRPASKSGKKASTNKEDEDDAPMSSIEQFDSPEKKQTGPAVIMAPKETMVPKGKQRESASDIWNSDVVQRGQELAEAAKQRNRGSRGTTPKAQAKKSLQDIIAETRARSNSALGATAARPPAPAPPLPIPEVDEEEDMGGTSTDVVPSASEPQAMDRDDRTFLEMEKAYVDLSGGTEDTSMQQDDSQPRDPILLRREEEESTQDIMAEIRAHQDQQCMNGIIEGGSSVPHDAAHTNTQDIAAPLAKESTEEVIPKIVPNPPAPATETLPVPRLTRSRSKSQTPLPQPLPRPSSRANSRVSKTLTSGRGSVPPPNIPTIPEVTEIDTGATQRMALTIADLQAQLAAEQAKNAELVKENAKEMQDWRFEADKFAETSAKLKAEHDADKLAWEDEKLQLTVQLDSARKTLASADKDRDFFREQYAKASGFVSSVRDENKDLEKRIAIAEEQTKTGVSLVRATFELRCRTLEDDLKSWRKMAEFLIEKDRRSDNDELRRRAAEEPELRALCQRQAASYAKAQERIFTLEADLEEQRRKYGDLEANYHVLQSETTRLIVDLSEASTKLERIGRADEYGNASLDETESGHEFVYRCKWRMGENEPCRDVFSTISELEQHLLVTGGHLYCT